jgi:alpha-beta hydrolase superfamily lysophospholipase
MTRPGLKVCTNFWSLAHCTDIRQWSVCIQSPGQMQQHLVDTTWPAAGLPFFMYGESLGGCLLLRLMCNRKSLDGLVAGYILSNPPVMVSEKVLPPKLVRKVLQGVGVVLPLYAPPSWCQFQFLALGSIPQHWLESNAAAACHPNNPAATAQP